jgi:mannosyl-3-phosphoglycerate phosphatase
MLIKRLPLLFLKTSIVNEAPLVISLGDGENDRAMLEASDYPVVIPGESDTLELNNPEAQTAEYKGPKGWNNTLLPLLEKLLKENCGG